MQHEEIAEAKNTLYNDSSYTEYIIRISHKDSFSVAGKQFYNRKNKQKNPPQINLIHHLVVLWKEVIKGYLKYSNLFSKIFFLSELSTWPGNVRYPAISELSCDFKYLQPWILKDVLFLSEFLWAQMYSSCCSKDKSVQSLWKLWKFSQNSLL